MDQFATASETQTDSQADETDRRMEDAAHFRGVLRGLIDLGAAMAQMVHQQGTAQPEALPDLAVAFDRVARTVRRCILLARKLDEPERAAGPNRAAARRRIIRAV